MNDYGFSLEEQFEINRIFKKNMALEKAVLFGSRAKKTHKPMSDVDIAIFGNALNHSNIIDLENYFEDSSLPYMFDIINFKSIKSPELLEHIKNYGKLIYSKNKDIFG